MHKPSVYPSSCTLCRPFSKCNYWMRNWGETSIWRSVTKACRLSHAKRGWAWLTARIQNTRLRLISIGWIAVAQTQMISYFCNHHRPHHQKTATAATPLSSVLQACPWPSFLSLKTLPWPGPYIPCRLSSWWSRLIKCRKERKRKKREKKRKKRKEEGKKKEKKEKIHKQIVYVLLCCLSFSLFL